MSEAKDKAEKQAEKQLVTNTAAVAPSTAPNADSAKDGAKDINDINTLRAQLAEAQAKAADAEERAAKAEEEKQRAEEDLKRRNDVIDNEVTRQEEAIKHQLKSQRKVRIRINSGKSQHEQCPVPVAVNGREYLIQRDKEVDVPQGVLSVLDLAKELVPNVVEENGQTRAVFRPTQRFSYSVVGYVNSVTGELER